MNFLMFHNNFLNGLQIREVPLYKIYSVLVNNSVHDFL